MLWPPPVPDWCQLWPLHQDPGDQLGPGDGRADPGSVRRPVRLSRWTRAGGPAPGRRGGRPPGWTAAWCWRSWWLMSRSHGPGAIVPVVCKHPLRRVCAGPSRAGELGLGKAWPVLSGRGVVRYWEREGATSHHSLLTNIRSQTAWSHPSLPLTHRCLLCAVTLSLSGHLFTPSTEY